jgi:hypothetical protein
MIASEQASPSGRPRWLLLFSALAGFVAAPFAITLIGRLLPAALPLWTPLALVVLAGGVGALRSGAPRYIGIGVIVGAATYAIFLLWLFGQYTGLGDL